MAARAEMNRIQAKAWEELEKELRNHPAAAVYLEQVEQALDSLLGRMLIQINDMAQQSDLPMKAKDVAPGTVRDYLLDRTFRTLQGEALKLWEREDGPEDD